MAYFKIKVHNNQIRFIVRGKSKNGANYALALSLHRTLRIPDDGKDYPLSPSLGRFPMAKVDDFKDRVPASWVERGGVIIPLYQREALWIQFHGRQWRPVAVKVAAGKINAVSGEPWTEELKEARSAKQDYMVAPPQPWLDGFNTGEGTIRQFVAMPLGMGYTVEGQVTGKEDVGGLQVLVFDPKEGKFPDHPPRPDTVLRGAVMPASMTYTSEGPGGQSVSVNHMVSEGSAKGMSLGFDEETPTGGGPLRGLWRARRSVRKAVEVKEMGLAAGGKLTQKIYPDNHGLDTWDPARTGRLFIHIVNSEVWREITGQPCPETPIDASTYTQAGYPWFALYDENQGDVEASAVLGGVASMAEKDKQHGFTKQMDNESVEVPPDNVVKYDLTDKDEVRDGSW